MRHLAKYHRQERERLQRLYGRGSLRQAAHGGLHQARVSIEESERDQTEAVGVSAPAEWPSPELLQAFVELAGGVFERFRCGFQLIEGGVDLLTKLLAST